MSGDRKVADPTKTASTFFTVTSVKTKKALYVSVKSGLGTVTRLATGEHVTVVRPNDHTVATVRADDQGVFTFSTKGLPEGTQTLTATGKLATRTGRTNVKIGPAGQLRSRLGDGSAQIADNSRLRLTRVLGVVVLRDPGGIPEEDRL